MSLGVELINGISEFMHIEKLAKVPYKYNRIFKGISISKEDIIFKDYANHFLKNENFFKKFKQNREKFGNELIKKNYEKNNIWVWSNFID